jgi:DNA-binding response OmpR family regulator
MNIGNNTNSADKKEENGLKGVNQLINPKKNIMIVDDEPDVAITLEAVLDYNGFEAYSFNDPLVALQTFKANLYNLVVLDVMMPKMDGLKLYQEIKKIDSSVKVLFLTALNDLAIYREYKNEKTILPNLDEICFVAKPINNSDLIQRVNAVIQLDSIGKQDNYFIKPNPRI